MKIAYIGIDLFYDALLTLDSLGCQVMEVFTCEVDNKTEFNEKVLNFAKEKNIPFYLKRITKEDIARLLKNGCKAAFCGGYYFKIPFDTNLPIVNIHPSLLPVGRGPWPMAQAILWKKKKSGVTLHKIAEGFDEGDIILQKEFLIDKDETHKTFMEKANGVLPPMIEALIADFDNLYQNAVPQKGGEYWETPTEKDFTVTKDMSVSEADLILRAFYGYECIYDSGREKRAIIGGRAVKGRKPEDCKYPLDDGYIEI